MSPRAAWRLEGLGLGPVYDYAAGKVDWIAAGLPSVRADASALRAIDVADRSPETCSPESPLDDLPAGVVIVTNRERVVLGRIDRGQRGPGVAGDVMSPGPTTVRAHEPLDELLERLRRRGVSEVIVTTPEGSLLGVVHALAIGSVRSEQGPPGRFVR